MKGQSVDPFAQTRTSRGKIPCSAVVPISNNTPCPLESCTAFRFDPLPPTAISLFSDENTASEDDLDLLGLTMCVSQQQGRIEVFRNALLDFALKSGPLFGTSTVESLFAWSSAALIANLALVLQEFVNGSMPVQASVVLGNLVKRTVSNPRTGATFDLLTISRLVESHYAKEMCGAAFVRREIRDGRINYSFLMCDDLEDGSSVVDLIVASFEQEMSLSDYLLLSRVLEFGEEVDAEAAARFGLSRTSTAEKSAYDFSSDVDLLSTEQPIDENDLPSLASAVHTLVAAHLQNARVDVFAADEKTGHLSFGNYLSWLWYDFSCKLDVARIGYCARCRKPFSLVGHRGIDRRFCSEACKTAAKNERSRRRRDALRQDFLSGDDVTILAHRYFEQDTLSTGQAKVRRDLESWPALKHTVDDTIEQEGWHAQLLMRCRKEGLNIQKLLTVKRRDQLKQMAQQRH